MNNNILTLEQIRNMSSDDLAIAFRNGYMLLEYSEQNGDYIKSLVPLTCPSPTPSIPQGTSKNIIVQVDTTGTPPYFYELLIDDVVKQRYPTTGTTNNTSATFSYNFPTETVGAHTVKTRLTDSCSPTPKVVTNQCGINITQACPVPSVIVTCPSSITQGSPGSIAATISTAGTSPYIYKLYRDAELTPIDTYPTTGTTTGTFHIFPHTFSESIANHTFRVDVIDSCTTPGPKTGSANCTVNIQSAGACTAPIVSTTCPTSIMQGSAGDIVATITTVGTPPYVYKLYRDAGPTPIDTYPIAGTTTDTLHVFLHTFSESVATHTYKVEVTDSCPSGALTGMDICSTIVQSGVPTTAGSAMMIVAVMAIGVAYFMMKKSK